MPTMDRQEVAKFVADLHAANLTVQAFGRGVYLIYDYDQPQPQCVDIGPRLDPILARYASRDQSFSVIVSYLRSAGLVYQPDKFCIR